MGQPDGHGAGGRLRWLKFSRRPWRGASGFRWGAVAGRATGFGSGPGRNGRRFGGESRGRARRFARRARRGIICWNSGPRRETAGRSTPAPRFSRTWPDMTWPTCCADPAGVCPAAGGHFPAAAVPEHVGLLAFRPAGYRQGRAPEPLMTYLRQREDSLGGPVAGVRCPGDGQPVRVRGTLAPGRDRPGTWARLGHDLATSLRGLSAWRNRVLPFAAGRRILAGICCPAGPWLRLTGMSWARWTLAGEVCPQLPEGCNEGSGRPLRVLVWSPDAARSQPGLASDRILPRGAGASARSSGRRRPSRSPGRLKALFDPDATLETPRLAGGRR